MFKKIILLLTIFLVSLVLQASNEEKFYYYGKASYYGKGFQGRKMSNGKKFSKDSMTCASNIFPIGTMLKIKRIYKMDTIRIVVEVTDRMSKRYGRKRLIDLSERAMRTIKGIKQGVIDIQIEPI